jgi:ABC-type multidrug transport system permease subunit
MLWPLEAMSPILQHIAYFLPFTMPVISLRNLLLKGSEATDRAVVSSFTVLAAWNVVSLFMCFILIKEKSDKPSKSNKSIKASSA